MKKNHLYLNNLLTMYMNNVRLSASVSVILSRVSLMSENHCQHDVTNSEVSKIKRCGVLQL